MNITNIIKKCEECEKFARELKEEMLKIQAQRDKVEREWNKSDDLLEGDNWNPTNEAD